MRKPPALGDSSTQDAQAFRAAVRDVKPLKQAAAAAMRATPRKKRLPVNAANALTPSLPPLVETATEPDESLAFRRPGVQDQSFRKLRRGLIQAQAQLDLHGLTQQQAWDYLLDFITASRDRQLRCVRVVHGKGYRSGARGPVLKSAVNTWLRHNHDVVAFVSARAIDGGGGALYVLLRA